MGQLGMVVGTCGEGSRSVGGGMGGGARDRCTVQCSLYSAHCTVYTLQCALYSLHCKVHWRGGRGQDIYSTSISLLVNSHSVGQRQFENKFSIFTHLGNLVKIPRSSKSSAESFVDWLVELAEILLCNIILNKFTYLTNSIYLGLLYKLRRY